MKKLLCMILALTLIISLAACGGGENLEPESGIASGDVDARDEFESATGTDAFKETEKDEADNEASGEAEKEEVKTEDKKDEPTKTEPAQKPSAPAEKPVGKPSEKPVAPSAPPAQKPAEKPSEKPAEPQTPPANDPPAQEAPSAGDTVGDTLAAVWRANSGKSTEEIANAVISHSSVQFMSAVVPVEEGFLTGFDNAEIKGFSSAHMFGPTIGTIAFVGYVFELSDGTDADAFVKTLKSSANPRWNICTEAEQTIVEKNGNKVFFLMCPKNFEE